MFPVFLLLVGLGLSSCGGPAPEVLELQKQTEQIHDDAMREMAQMNRVGRSLRKDLAALDSLAPRRDSILAALSLAEQAEAGMYAWMQQYNAPAPRADSALTYLAAQKSLIEQNQRELRAALSAGEQLLSKQ